MKDPSQRAWIPPPRGIKDLLVMVSMIHHEFSQQEIQVMMTVFMDEVVDKVQIGTIKTVDKREPRTMPVTETDDALCFQRDDP